jgi:hypothetical protein
MTASRVPRADISPELRHFLDQLARETAFGNLVDTPTTLAGYGITDAETLGQLTAINTQTASYTLVLTDKGKTVEMNVGSANNLTVPPNADVAFPTNSYINATQLGAGQTTLVAGSGVTLRSRNGLKLAGQYAVATLYKRGTNEWVCGGDLTA